MLPILLIIGLYPFFNAFIGTQALTMIITDLDVYYSPEYFDPDYEVFLLDNGIDNEVFLNFTIIKTIPIDAEMHTKLMGATMGEYKIPTGLDYAFNVCEIASEPIMGGQLFENFGIGDCPIEPGVYGNPSFIFDPENFPDTFYGNKYLAQINLRSSDNKIIFVNSVYLRMQ